MKKSESSTRQARNKAAIMALLGGRCARCRFADIRVLQIDHVKGNGSKDKRGARAGGNAYYVRVLRFLLRHPNQKIYQCLCANCGWIKRAERDENPRHYGRVKQ